LAIVSLVAVTAADAAARRPVMEDRHVSGEPGEITVKFREIQLPPNTDVHYRISVGRLRLPYVTPWKLDSDVVWDGVEYRTYGRRTLWSDPSTGLWYRGVRNCCAGPTWEYTATSDATGTVHGETSYRWQANPGVGWLLSHYTIAKAVIEDLTNGAHMWNSGSYRINSYRIKCEHFSTDHLLGIRSGDERPVDPSPRTLCEVQSPARWSPGYDW
jgi:hypothetical protein